MAGGTAAAAGTAPATSSSISSVARRISDTSSSDADGDSGPLTKSQNAFSATDATGLHTIDPRLYAQGLDAHVGSSSSDHHSTPPDAAMYSHYRAEAIRLSRKWKRALARAGKAYRAGDAAIGGAAAAEAQQLHAATTEAHALAALIIEAEMNQGRGLSEVGVLDDTASACDSRTCTPPRRWPAHGTGWHLGKHMVKLTSASKGSTHEDGLWGSWHCCMAPCTSQRLQFEQLSNFACFNACSTNWTCMVCMLRRPVLPCCVAWQRCRHASLGGSCMTAQADATWAATQHQLQPPIVSILI